LLTALPPAPPMPNTVIRGFKSAISGMRRFKVMIISACFIYFRRLMAVVFALIRYAKRLIRERHEKSLNAQQIL
jgi:hypothetical protein